MYMGKIKLDWITYKNIFQAYMITFIRAIQILLLRVMKNALRILFLEKNKFFVSSRLVKLIFLLKPCAI